KQADRMRMAVDESGIDGRAGLQGDRARNRRIRYGSDFPIRNLDVRVGGVFLVHDMDCIGRIEGNGSRCGRRCWRWSVGLGQYGNAAPGKNQSSKNQSGNHLASAHESPQKKSTGSLI